MEETSGLGWVGWRGSGHVDKGLGRGKKGTKLVLEAGE